MDFRITPKLRPRTLSAQAASGQPFDAGAALGTAIVPPIHVATTFERDADNGYRSGYVYGRSDNATVRQTESVIAALEGAQSAMLFGSGMAAATAVVLSLDAGAHIVAPQVMYWGLRRWFAEAAGRFNLDVSFIDMTDLAAVRAAMRPGRTRLVWIETPSNPLWTITDIEAVAKIAHAAGAHVVADSTVATPVFTQPLALGVDIVAHSATKYLNGHSDVIAGALACAREDGLWERISALRGQHGGILGPFEAWLLLRGLRTLDVRVKAQTATAMKLADSLCSHPKIATVLYPGLEHHPGHALAARQMSGFGAMLSIRLKAGEAGAIATAARVELWKRATSLGGVESLIEHRSSIEGANSPCPHDLLRLSVGLEDPDDLLDDLDRALD
jgi:cystathionine gamma-synthase